LGSAETPTVVAREHEIHGLVRDSASRHVLSTE